MFPFRFWDNALWKEAARAGLRQISRMVNQGNIAGASALAKTPGVLKPSAAGSQIQHLGRGNEGMATMVAHPEHGVAVRKLYDPRGVSTPEMIARKEEAGRAMGNNPNFAQFYGSAQTPHGGGTMHFSEFVPSSSARQKDGWSKSTAQTAQRANQSLGAAGYEGHDIRPGNMIQTPTGQQKVVDYIPGRSGEMQSNPATPNVIGVTPKGSSLFQNQPHQTTTKGMLGGMLGGKAMGVRRNVGIQRPPNPAAGTAPLSPPDASPTAVGRPSPAFTPKPTPSSSAATTPIKAPKPLKPIG